MYVDSCMQTGCTHISAFRLFREQGEAEENIRGWRMAYTTESGAVRLLLFALILLGRAIEGG
jgi:hypothetical protein